MFIHVHVSAFTTNAITSDFLSSISPGWVVMFLDSNRTVFTFCSWLDMLGVALAFGFSFYKSSNYFQSSNTWLYISQSAKSMYSGHTLSFYLNLSFQEYVSERISNPAFYGDQVYKLRKVKCDANFVLSGSKIVKHLRYCMFLRGRFGLSK